MHPPQGRKPRGVMATEVAVDGDVLVVPEELPDQFHGQHLAVGQRRGGPARPDARPVGIGQQVGQQLLDQAQHGYSEIFQVHGAPPCEYGSSPPMVGPPRGPGPETCTSVISYQL